MNTHVDVMCPACREPWHAFKSNTSCPHCGLEAKEAFVTELLTQDGSSVRLDVNCIDCGYNLRMQPIEGRCPECATAVGDSLTRGRLTFMPVTWLRRVGNGIRETFFALSLIVVLGAYSFGSWYIPGSLIPGLPAVGWIVLSVVMLVAIPALWFGGMWRATAPADVASSQWRFLERRRVASRLLSLGSVIATIVVALLMIALIDEVSRAWDEVSRAWFVAVWALVIVLPAVLLLSTLLYATVLHSYLRQQRSEWLQRVLRIWAWLLAVSLVIYGADVLLDSLGAGEFLRGFNMLPQLASIAFGLMGTFFTWRHFRATVRAREKLTSQRLDDEMVPDLPKRG